MNRMSVLEEIARNVKLPPGWFNTSSHESSNLFLNHISNLESGNSSVDCSLAIRSDATHGICMLLIIPFHQIVLS